MENSVARSWTKILSISGHKSLCLRLCILKSGEILLESLTGGLAVYNPENDVMEDCEICNLCLPDPDDCVLYA